MRRFAICLLTAAAMLAGATALHAQVPVVTYYQPTTVYYSTPVAAPVATSYTVASPVVVSTPAPTVTYYRAPTYTYYPATPVVTRYRPFLGRTVVRYPYAPVVYYP